MNNSNNQNFSKDLNYMGIVTYVADGVVQAYGLLKGKAQSTVFFPRTNLKGSIMNLENFLVNIVIYGNESEIVVGDILIIDPKEEVLALKVNENLLGRVINPLGDFLDEEQEQKNINNELVYQLIEIKAPGIIDRKSVHEPMQTGIKAIDSLLPIGRGQRELIIGDRQTGKTAIGIDTIINQKIYNNDNKNINKHLYCIYVAIGQKKIKCSSINWNFEKI